MGEFLRERGGGEEGGVGGHWVEPLLGVVGLERLIERRVDFDGVEELREISGFVKAFWARRGIDVTGPIGVRPAGRANANMFQGGEGSAHRLRVGYWSCAFSRHFESTKGGRCRVGAAERRCQTDCGCGDLPGAWRNCNSWLTMWWGTTLARLP